MRTYVHSLRFLGLLIEMTGVVGIIRERAGTPMPHLSIPGGPTVSWAWVAVVIGFVVWLVARIILASTRPDGQKAGVVNRYDHDEDLAFPQGEFEPAQDNKDDDDEHSDLARGDEKR